MDETRPGVRHSQPTQSEQRRSQGVVGRGMAQSMGFALRERFWLYETSGVPASAAKPRDIPGGFLLRPAFRSADFGGVAESSERVLLCTMRVLRGATSAERQRKDRVLRALGARQRASQPPRLHDRDAIAHAENLRHLGRDHEDRDAAFGEPSHQLVNLRLGADVHALRGLIEDQDLRMRLEPAREGDLLLVASRQRPHVGVDRSRLDAQVFDVRRVRPAAPTRHR